MKLSDLFSTISRIHKNLCVQKEFLQHKIASILSEASANNDGSLEESDFKKITHYYGLAVPAILAEAFCILHGRKLSEKERWVATCQGAMTGLFDDFFDKNFLEEELILQKTNRNLSSNIKKQNEYLFDVFYEGALTQIHDQKNMMHGLKAVYDAQLESKKQTSVLKTEEILKITLQKGGFSLLFYRTSIHENLSVQEKEMLYIAGGLMQLCNDIFDTYKDRENNICTLATICTNPDNLLKIFRQQYHTLKLKVDQLPFKKENKKSFLQMLDLAVFCRTEVCLQQLIKFSKKHEAFNVQNLTRKQLICDMDTTKNKLKAAMYFLKH